LYTEVVGEALACDLVGRFYLISCISANGLYSFLYGFDYDASEDDQTVFSIMGFKVKVYAIAENLQDTWLEDFDKTSQSAYFGTSQKGWTSDQLALQWLERFHESSFQISGYQKRLLILGGHGSHCTIEFLMRAAEYNILIAIFPPPFNS
jgi:hypothetical protein